MGIEVVAGVCIVLVSFLIILVVAFLSRFERQREKIKESKDDKNVRYKLSTSVGKGHDVNIGKNISVSYKHDTDQDLYVNVKYSKDIENLDVRL
jgi:Na+-transporting methylmalonyl-CoA/oxaloacetate decarboxylase gamma subunit